VCSFLSDQISVLIASLLDLLALPFTMVFSHSQTGALRNIFPVDKVENKVDSLYVTLKNQHKTNTYFPSSLQVRASLKV
jgi:hypothetical protein